ncbi:methyltransferase [Streptomyces sp. URMC 124]|uniref:methyltransferase n=1 Tax=Streptomyces sp. URMC 124 TaxID=3423405 RepID=UPI003F5384D7
MTERGLLLRSDSSVASHVLYAAGPGVNRAYEQMAEVVLTGQSGGEVAGQHVYMVKSILVDWSDEEVTRLLGNLHRAMAPGTRLLVVDWFALGGSCPGKRWSGGSEGARGGKRARGRCSHPLMRQTGPPSYRCTPRVIRLPVTSCAAGARM